MRQRKNRGLDQGLEVISASGSRLVCLGRPARCTAPRDASAGLGARPRPRPGLLPGALLESVLRLLQRGGGGVRVGGRRGRSLRGGGRGGRGRRVLRARPRREGRQERQTDGGELARGGHSSASDSAASPPRPVNDNERASELQPLPGSVRHQAGGDHHAGQGEPGPGGDPPRVEEPVAAVGDQSASRRHRGGRPAQKRQRGPSEQPACPRRRRPRRRGPPRRGRDVMHGDSDQDAPAARARTRRTRVRGSKFRPAPGDGGHPRFRRRAGRSSRAWDGRGPQAQEQEEARNRQRTVGGRA